MPDPRQDALELYRAMSTMDDESFELMLRCLRDAGLPVPRGLGTTAVGLLLPRVTHGEFSELWAAFQRLQPEDRARLLVIAQGEVVADGHRRAVGVPVQDVAHERGAPADAELAEMQARAERAEAEVERLRQRVDVYDAFATRNAAIEEAARAAEGEPPTIASEIGLIEYRARRRAAAAIRALKT